jgi:hypothetical protein
VFEVVKINHRNRKQDRLLGIDQYRIYNLVNKKKTQKKSFSLKNIFASGKTKNPERLMDDVLEVKILRKKSFMISVRDFDGKTKNLVF